MTDRELLAEYVRSGSERAFAQIFARHGAMVYSACRRVLGDAAAAEDATQAAFLVLVRKARGIDGSTLPGWLFRTAERSAREVRRARDRRVRHEGKAAMKKRQQAPREARWEEVAPEIDAALASLPSQQANVVAMRILENRPQAEVARELRCGESTVSSLLSRALDALRARLARRGVTLSVAALGAMLAENAVGPVPAELAGSVAAVCSGKVAASAAVLGAKEGVMKAMLMAKLKLAAAVIGTAMAVGAGGGALAVKLAATERSSPHAGAAVAPDPSILAAAAGEKAKWPVSTPVAGELKVNEWVKVEEHGAARRKVGALAWLPAEKSFLLAMGIQGEWNDAGPFCYDEQTFSLEDRLWKNRFPPGKPWRPEVGVSDAPLLTGSWMSEGRIRLVQNWGYGFPACAFALDTDRNTLLAYGRDNRTVEYDCARRSWRELKPKGDPTGGAQHPLQWGSLCYDAHNREFLLFGGSNGGSEFCDTRTWACSPAANEWRRVESDSEGLKRLRARAEALRIEAVKLHGAHCNRYFKTELAANAGTSLAEAAKTLGSGIEALKKDLAGPADGYEKTQRERSAADLVAAGTLAAKLGDAAPAESCKMALQLTRVLWRAMTALMNEPPPRAHSQMVYDPETKKIVLFGGDRLDMLYADTWVYDCPTRTWQERRPETSPSPRAGHAFLRLPDSGKLVLLGGYEHTSVFPLHRQLPMQAWSYDVVGNKWTLVRDWGKPYPDFMHIGQFRFLPAAGAGDVVLALSRENGMVATLACKLDASRADAAGQAKSGVGPGAVQWRAGGGYDPDWYLEGPSPDEAAFQATLKALPANTWTELTAKEMRLPPGYRGWGTAAYDPDRQAIYIWGGGHSYHCGTDVPAFSMRTGRYHIKYPPSFPLNWCGANSGTPLEMSFMAQPFVPVHSYHSYAYDPAVKKLFCTGLVSLYPHDPDSGLWRHDDSAKRMPVHCMGLILCSTPLGACAWAKGKLFRHDSAKDGWIELALTGEALPGPQTDKSSMCYDSKRGRLLLIAEHMNGGLIAVDLKTSVATRLAPNGMGQIRPRKGYPAMGDLFLREVCYDEANDLMVVDSVGDTWTVYDCAKNAWVALTLPGRPVHRDGAIGISYSLMYDPLRKLVLSMNTYNRQVHALRLEPKSAEPRELE